MPDEPRRVAEAVVRLGLKHVVVTCVTRDDLPDGGAEHYVKTIEAIRAATDAVVEVLPSDFNGNLAALDRVIDAAPEVYNHNTETVPRLYRSIRGPRSKYPWTLAMFRRIAQRNPAIKIKSGLMLGIGETHEELLDTLADLHDAGVRLLTLGQYLQPSLKQMAVVRYLPVEEFEQLGDMARQIGFTQVASGPFVRSSYHARDMAEIGITMPRIELCLPDLGLDDQPITLSGWLVPRGARVAAGERVAEVLAGPATVDLPSPVDGVLVERLVDEDEPITVGQPLAVIEDFAITPCARHFGFVCEFFLLRL